MSVSPGIALRRAAESKLDDESVVWLEGPRYRMRLALEDGIIQVVRIAESAFQNNVGRVVSFPAMCYLIANNGAVKRVHTRCSISVVDGRVKVAIDELSILQRRLTGLKREVGPLEIQGLTDELSSSAISRNRQAAN